MNKFLVIIISLFLGCNVYAINWTVVYDDKYNNTGYNDMLYQVLIDKSSIQKYNMAGRNHVYSVYLKKICNYNNELGKLVWKNFTKNANFNEEPFYYIDMALIDCERAEVASKYNIYFTKQNIPFKSGVFVYKDFELLWITTKYDIVYPVCKGKYF